MGKPENDEFLVSLYHIKNDCDVGLAVAEASGELEEARQLQNQLADVTAMIERLERSLYA